MRGCVIPGCHLEHNARGLCVNHYYHWQAGHLSVEHLALMSDPGVVVVPAAFCSCVEPVVQTFLGLPSCAVCNKGFRP
jgi:hypothetical protein